MNESDTEPERRVFERREIDHGSHISLSSAIALFTAFCTVLGVFWAITSQMRQEFEVKLNNAEVRIMNEMNRRSLRR